MKSIRNITALLLLLCMSMSLVFCNSVDTTKTPDTSAQSITVKDMIGREVEITPGSYKRVVCIGAGALRMYSYVGDISLLCGVEDIDNLTLSQRPKMFDSSPRPYVMAFGDSFSKLPSCGVGGPNAQTAEPEKILSCDPDIVISEYEDADKEDSLQNQLGVPVITLRSGPSGVFGDEFRGSMKLLGEIFGKNERAEEIVSFVESESAEIARRTGNIKDEDKPYVYIGGLGNWGTTNHLFTCENYSTFAVTSVKNVLSDLGMKGIGAIESEKFVSIGENTDIMFIDAAAIKNIKPLFAEDPALFDCSKAWNNGNVYLQMAYNSYYTNYEIALANAWYIAKTVYPDSFSDIDITAKLNSITDLFLGKELAEEIYACPASFGGYRKIDSEFLNSNAQ